MTQLEQINEEKRLLKEAISKSVTRMNEIIEGAKMNIDIQLHYHISSGNKTKLAKVDIETRLEL